MNIILAPMQGLTELLFRRVYAETFPGACDGAVSPFLSLTHGALPETWKHMGDVWPQANEGSLPVVPQILGCDPEGFIALANKLYSVGYREVNWNIGCPMRRIAAKHRGSGILPYPEEIARFLERVVPHLQAQLSVKMRLGYRQPQEIFDLVPILNRFPLKSITLHPRTGRQMYGGTVDLDTFNQVLPLLQAPVIYNGDICSVEDYKQIRSRFPNIIQVMIGRGILRHPPLPWEIQRTENPASVPSPAADDAAHTSLLLHRLIEEIDRTLPSDTTKCRKAKEYWCLMADAVGASPEARSHVLHAESFDEVRRRIAATMA